MHLKFCQIVYRDIICRRYTHCNLQNRIAVNAAEKLTVTHLKFNPMIYSPVRAGPLRNDGKKTT